MNPTDQIAAEAVKLLMQHAATHCGVLLNEFAVTQHIKSACEKAKLEGWKEGRRHLRESQRPTPATASEDFSKSGLSAGATQTWREASDKPDSAAASEIVPAGEVEGKALTPKQCADQFRLYAKSHPSKDSQHSLRFCADFLDEYCAATPSGDPASTGKHSMGEGANRSQRLRAHIPEYAGEWTVDKLKSVWREHYGESSFYEHLMFVNAIIYAHNAALRDYGNWRAAHDEVSRKYQQLLGQLRDCGNDTKRLDLMETQGGQFAKIKGKSWRESADIHAAMLENGDQKVDWLRAAAGPTEEQQK